MSARVTWSGLDALIQQLTDAPAHIREQGFDIVRSTTEAAAVELQRSYPVGPGQKGKPGGALRRGVKTFYPSTTILLGKVISAAPHAHLWHWGTQTRTNAAGANRGRMPAAAPDPLVPIAERHRGLMFRRLALLLESMGFKVAA